MQYNPHLDIKNLKQNDFKDEWTTDFTALTYILGKEILRIKAYLDSPDSDAKNITFFIGPQVFGVILNMVNTLVPRIEDSEYAGVYHASIKAIETLYRDRLFSFIRAKYTEEEEIDRSMVEVGELDEEDVTAFTDEEIYAHIDITVIPNLAFINMSFYATYKNTYDLLKLDDIENPEFWYNEYFEIFISKMNYLNFVTF